MNRLKSRCSSPEAYDANGNILLLERSDANGVQFDDLSYKYNDYGSNGRNQNRLYHVDDDNISSSLTDIDIDDQGTFQTDIVAMNTQNNYSYDEIGNLIKDNAEEIANIEWTVGGKIKSITRTTSSTLADLEFRYDTQGNRISKIVKPAGTNGQPEEWVETIYVRDATSNIMAIYERKAVGSFMEFRLKERPIYGSSRIGVKTSNLDMTLTPSTTEFNRLLGQKQYEGVNHLGNVLLTFTDKKIPRSLDGTSIAYYMADVVSATDYYPGGSIMPGRWSGTDYRYGFGNQEMDNEIKGHGNSYSYTFRMYDPRLVRWLSIDPLARQFPFYTPYQFAGNSPIRNVDLEGAEDLPNEIYNKAKTLGINLIKKATAAVVAKVVEITVDYVAEKTAEKIQEKTTPEQQQVAGLTGEYLFGVGDANRSFGPNDPTTKALQDAPKVNEARDMFLGKNAENIKNGKPLEPLTEFGGSFGLVGSAKAGTDLTEQFVGSMNIEIFPSEDGKTATFVITNSTSYESGTYGLGTSYERGESDSDAGATTRQTYTFTESIPQPKKE